MKSWRGLRQKPLDNAVKREQAKYPRLQRLQTSSAVHGLQVHCDELADELATLWRSVAGRTVTSDWVRRVVARFYPLAVGFAEHDRMQDVLKCARQVIDDKE